MFSRASYSYLRELRLDNCGVDDGELASILRSLYDQNTFKVFYYKHNSFMEESLEALKPILLKQHPNHLSELRLISCQTTTSITEGLVEYILEEAYSLQTLGLISMQVTEEALNNITQIVEKSIWLESLDISWNSLKPSSFRNFFEVLEKNRNLQFLNLSHNMLVPRKDQLERGDLAIYLLSKNSMFKPVRDFIET